MIKNALKNFFKNFVYVFVPMGVVYLFVLLAVFLTIGSLVQITGGMLSKIFNLIQYSVGESSASVNDFLSYAFGQLDLNGSFINMIVRAFETRWLSNTVVGFLQTLNASTEGFSEQIATIMNDFVANLRVIVSFAITLCVIGIIAANFLTRYMVRRRTAKRGLKKFIIARTVVPVVESIFVAGSVAILAALRYYGLLVVAALIILSGAFSLTSSWIVHKKGDIRIRDVVTLKNIVRHAASAGVILLIDVVIAVALFFVSPLLAVLITVPVVLYSLGIIGVNTDSFVCEMIAAREKQRAADGEGMGEAAAETAIAGAETAIVGAETGAAPTETPAAVKAESAEGGIPTPLAAPAPKSSPQPRKKRK